MKKYIRLFFVCVAVLPVAAQCQYTEVNKFWEIHDCSDELNINTLFNFSVIQTAGSLPRKVDLRRYCPVPYDQGSEGSCAAWAIAYSLSCFNYNLEHHITRRLNSTYHEKSIEYSPRFTFNAVKACTDAPSEISCQVGVHPSFIFKQMYCMGTVHINHFDVSTAEDACKEIIPARIFDFPQDSFYTVPSYKIIWQPTELGQNNEGISRNSLLTAIKFCLSQNIPVVLTFYRVPNLYNDYVGQGIMAPKAAKVDSHMLHTVLCVGYNDKGKTITILNSFGTNWGSNGFIEIPYSIIKRDINMAAVSMPLYLSSIAVMASPLDSVLPDPFIDTTTWFKKGYYRVIGKIRIGLQDLQKVNGRYQARVIFSKNNGELFNTINLGVGEENYFYLPGRKVTFTFLRADCAGKTLRKAVFFHVKFEKTTDKTHPEQDNLLKAIKKYREN